MGIQDLMTVFDRLNPTNTGYISVDQLYELLKSVYIEPVLWAHVEAAVLHVCGPDSGNKVNREDFEAVLEEVERRRALDEQAYWDFQALDCNGSHIIRLSDAFMLFQEYHGDCFSIHTWKRFLSSRVHSDAGVCFDEIRFWLCEVPSGEPIHDRELQDEKARLDYIQWQHSRSDYEAFRLLQREEAKEYEEEENSKDLMQQNARRKLIKWQHQGLEAMLDDSGLDIGEDVLTTAVFRDIVSASDLLDALSLKYQLLVDSLSLQMADFAANMDSEKWGLVQNIKKKVGAMFRQGQMCDVESLPGASALLPATLTAMMGDLRPAHQQRMTELMALRQKLAAEGRAVKDIEDSLRTEYESTMKGPVTCGQALCDLVLRKSKEKDLLVSLLYGEKPGDWSYPCWMELCHLQRQHAILQELKDFSLASLAVGLAERPQTYKPSVYDCDRKRSEQLAAKRLALRLGHVALRATAQLPDMSDLAKHGVVNIRAIFVKEIEHRYYLEREALTAMLQGPDSAQSISAAKHKSAEERHQQLTILRNRHINWKKSKLGDPDANMRTLQEAVGLYWAERQNELEREHPNVESTRVSAAVLADLQQRQEVDFSRCLGEMNGKKEDELIHLLKRECRIRCQEHLENIAFVVLGVVDISDEEQEYITALEEKYQAIRDQILVFALRDKYGIAAWNSMGREGRRTRLQQLRKEEKRMRCDGCMQDMGTLLGPKSQALPILASLVGDVKKYGKAHMTALIFRPQNLLADTVSRFDLEQEVLLSWLKSSEIRDRAGQRAKLLEFICLDMERFLISVDSDYEAGLLALGLLERIGTINNGRSKDDLERQKKLAAKRVVLRKCRILNGELYKNPAEDKKQPEEGDNRGWQCALMRSVLRRQASERESLLRILQDPTFSDLVEAAAMMASEERWHRQRCLSDKHQCLDLSGAEGYEDQISILEEAAALRIVGLQAVAHHHSGQALSEDDIATALMKELQDLQDTELAQMLADVLSMEGELLKKKTKDEKKAYDEQHGFNVMAVLSHLDGDSSITDAFIKIVENKYAVLRDLLLTFNEEQEGASLSPIKKTKQLQQLPKEVVLLWDAGDAEGIVKLLTQSRILPQPLAWMFGTDRGSFTKQKDMGGAQQKLKEQVLHGSENTGILASVKHLMQRCADEKDFISKILAGTSGQFLTESMKLTLKSRLKREITIITEEDNIITAALACGLTERQTENFCDSQLEQDRERYKQLAEGKYFGRKKSKEGNQEEKCMVVDRLDNKETLQDAVLKLLHTKQKEECQLLVEMLTSSRFPHIQQMTALESHQQRADRLEALHAKWELSNKESSTDNIALLQEALVVLREDRRNCQGQDSSEDEQLNCWLMAEVLHLQNCEAEQCLMDFHTEEADDLIEHQEQIIRETTNNHCNNIATLVFLGDFIGHHQRGVDPIIEAIEGKYDALRNKLLMQTLKKQIGESNWQKLSEEEQMRRLMELKTKEKRLRCDKKYDELATLIGDALNNEETLRRLVGENQEDYDKKLQNRMERRRQRMAEGISEEECSQMEEEEEKQEEAAARQRGCNVLLGLQHNFQQECEALLRLMEKDPDAIERERQQQLLWLRLEQRRLRQEDDIDTSAFLIQQYNHALKGSTAERHRQEQLARERLKAACIRKEERASLLASRDLPVDRHLLDLEQDKARLQEMALTSLDFNLQAERNLLIKLLKDWSAEKHAREEGKIPISDLLAQLEELDEVFQTWQSSCFSSGQYDSAGLQLLKDALIYTMEIKRRWMEQQGRSTSDPEMQVSLLADLQEIQDREVKGMMMAVIDMDLKALKQLILSLTKNRDRGYLDNVAQVLLHPTGAYKVEISAADQDEGLTGEEKEERRLMKALEFKYDALRDKIIIEALIKQLGDAAWQQMSELERQRQVVDLRRKERKLRQDGKKDEIEALIGQHLKHKEYLSKIFGESKEEQKLRLKERLARRQQLKVEREAAGLDTDDKILDALMLQEEQKLTTRPKNLLDDLAVHFEEERTSLLEMLSGGNSQEDRAKQRWQALIKLQQEKDHIAAEEDIDGALLIFSLGSQAAGESLLEEREKQKQLAQERLMQHHDQTINPQTASLEKNWLPLLVDENIILDPEASELVCIQKGVLVALDQYHKQERSMLMQLLNRCRQDKAASKILQTVSSEGLRQKLSRIEKDYATLQYQSIKEITALSASHPSARFSKKLERKASQNQQARHDILAQALASKLELERRQFVESCPGVREEEVWEELCVLALADLQERQMEIYNSTLDFVFSKNKENVMKMHNTQQVAEHEGWFQNLQVLVFSISDMAGEHGKLQQDQAAEAKLQEEFKQQKEALMRKGKQENMDVSAMLQELQAQYEAKLQSLAASKAQQTTTLAKKLEAKRRHLEEDAEAALEMLRQVQAHAQNAQEKIMAERSNQSSLLEERLKQRREARSLLQQGRQKWEMTHIDANVSDDQKRAVYIRLMHEQQQEQSLRTAERQRQREELKRRLEARKGRRGDEVAALFSLGERQKTSLEEAKKSERDRQLAHMKEQLSRARLERTMTQKGSSPVLGKSFLDMAQLEGDEKMMEKAHQLQYKFTLQTLTEEKASGTDSGARLNENSRMDILKERRRMRKQQRQDGK